MRLRIEVGELSAWAVLANGRRKMVPWDIVGLRRPERGLAWLQLAEGVRQLEFDARELVQLFNVASSATPPGRPETDDAADLGRMRQMIGRREAVTIGKAALAVLREPGRQSENALEDSIKRRLVRKYRELVAVGDAPFPVAQVEK